MVRSSPSQISNFDVGWRDVDLSRPRPHCTTCELHTLGPLKTAAVRDLLVTGNVKCEYRTWIVRKT